MKINAVFDASAAGAPAGFETAVNAAIAFLDAAIATPITVNIQFGWGEVGGQSMGAGSLGESLPFGSFLSYSQLRTALAGVASDSDETTSVSTLPVSDPTSGGLFFVNTAEQKALGIIDYTGIDGYVSLNSTASYTFDPNNRAVSGEYDAIGILEHEITEILGRDATLGLANNNDTNIYSPMDLFRYASPGVRSLAPAAGSFSINGSSLLDLWNNPLNGGDGGDWDSSVVNDAFDAFATQGVQLSVSATDLRLMDVLGFHPSAPAPSLPPNTVTPGIGGSSPQSIGANTTIGSGQQVYFPFGAGASNVTGYTMSGAANLTDNGTVTLISASAAGGVGVAGTSHGGAFQVGSSGQLFVEATAAGATADGFSAVALSSSVTDNDLIQVVSTQGTANGIISGDSTTTINIGATGTLKVWGGTSAVGVELSNGGALTNGGGIQVSSVNAVGVEGASSFTNNGVITATGINGGQGTAIGVDIAAPTAGGPTLSTLTNNGVITADVAINIDANSFNQITPNVTIANTGKITGIVAMANGNDTITNGGVINGPIYFGDGATTYNGASGSQSGGIYLGFGTNHATLGNDGEAIYGGFGADTITGGSGNDVIEIGGGNNTIDGGGGFNVLSFGNSPAPITVSLLAGTATDDGADTLKNIQEVVGSGAAGNSITLGAASQTAIAGNGGGATLIGAAAGADTFVLGQGGGAATLVGNGNTVIFDIADGPQTISGFNASDVVNIYGHASPLSVTQVGSSVVIRLSASDEVFLQNTTLAQINTTDVVYNAAFYQGQALPASQPPYGTNSIFIEQDFTLPAPASISEQGEPWGFVNDGHSLTVNGSVTVDFPVAALADDDYGWIDNNIDQFGHLIAPTGDAVTLALASTFTVNDLEGGAVGFAPLFATSLSNSGTVTITAGGAAWGVQAPSSVFNYTSAPTAHMTVSATGAAIGLELGDGGQITNKGSLQVTGGAGGYGVQIDQAQGRTLINSGTISVSGGGAGAKNYAIAVGGSGTGVYTITNNGVISGATAAITAFFDGAAQAQVPGLAITNVGTITGEIDLEAGISSLISTGTITGNIVVQDNSAVVSGAPGNTIDLSQDKAFTGQILLEAGTAGNIVIADTIKTGVGSTTIKASTGESNTSVTVQGLASAATTLSFDIASSQASLTHQANGAWSVNAGTDGVFVLTGVQTLQFTDKTLHLAQGQPAADDFAGTGMSGILFAQADGTLGDWLMNGTVMAGGATFGSPGGTWAAVAAGDFNGDGRADVVFEDATGDVATWELNGTAIIGGGLIGNPGGTWAVKGVGAFTGQAMSDIIFQDATGNVALWDLTGTAITGGGIIGNPGGTWAVKGAGDFNGDGFSDILFQDKTGAVATWEMHGTAIVGGGNIGNPGGTWAVEGAGDFNGDGKSDILFEDATGNYAIWEMNGTSIIGGGNIGNPGGTWHFAGIGDFNGDGHADILFADASGNLAFWEMNGTAIIGGGNIGNPGAIWHVLG